MIVPLMIWSARTVIDNQAWTSEMSSAVSRAATRAINSAGVIPKIGDGSAGRSGATATPTIQATKALASIVPSIPMLTTPDRSQITPHRAPRASGVAACRRSGEMSGTMWTT